jgi:uncharacterized membrane protein YccC
MATAVPSVRLPVAVAVTVSGAIGAIGRANGSGSDGSRRAGSSIGDIAGGGFGLAVLLLAQGNPAVLIAGTAIGIVVGRHIENGLPNVTYLGLQFTLAVLVALVPDSYANAQIVPALQRLLSILIGMAVLEPVLLGWHLVAPRETARSVPDGPNEE